MPRAAARAMPLLTTPPATLSNTFVPADEQPRLGEQVVHGGDALTTKKLPPNSEELLLHKAYIIGYGHLGYGIIDRIA